MRLKIGISFSGNLILVKLFFILFLLQLFAGRFIFRYLNPWLVKPPIGNHRMNTEWKGRIC